MIVHVVRHYMCYDSTCGTTLRVLCRYMWCVTTCAIFVHVVRDCARKKRPELMIDNVLHVFNQIFLEFHYGI